MCDNKRTPHKHADLIKAWADGAEIQLMSKFRQGWVDVDPPRWCEDSQYRIKPEQSDLEKYGVEVGDVWALRDRCGRYFVKYEPVQGKQVCFHRLYNGDEYSAWPSDFAGLIFRRGVVNKL